MTHALRFRIKGLFVGAAFVVIGGGMALSIAHEWWTARRSGSWTPVQAVVVAAGERPLTLTGGDGTKHQVLELDFRYRYQVGGVSYESERLSFVKDEVDVRDRPGFLRAHPVGSALTVHHDPTRPEEAVVEPGGPAIGILFAFLPALFVPLGLFLIWGSANGAIVAFCERRGLRYR